jgi:hypothetical protein
MDETHEASHQGASRIDGLATRAPALSLPFPSSLRARLVLAPPDASRPISLDSEGETP